MSETPRTDKADDKTMRYSARHERVRDLCEQFERILIDLRDHGLRFDLNPTVAWSNEETLALCYLDYIRRMDERVREIARVALI